MSFLETDGGRLRYDFTPGIGPCLVLSHGYGMSGEIWDDTVSRVAARGYPVLRYDHRCCGGSTSTFTDVSVSAQGADIVSLCEHLGLNEVILNGWSLGGAIVVDAAHRLGSRAVGLILTGGATPRYTQADGFPYGGTPADVAATVDAIRADRESFLKTLYYEGVFVAPVPDHLKAECLHIALQAHEKSDDSLGDLANIDQRNIMAGLDCPVLIAHGIEDGVVPVEIAKFAGTVLKQPELLLLENCGHAPFLEHPETYHGALLSFMEKLVK